jgi:hypothetical protein
VRPPPRVSAAAWFGRTTLVAVSDAVVLVPDVHPVVDALDLRGQRPSCGSACTAGSRGRRAPAPPHGVTGPDMHNVTLNDGVEMPILGFDALVPADEAEEAVLRALVAPWSCSGSTRSTGSSSTGRST